jgi:DNA polymerase V
MTEEQKPQDGVSVHTGFPNPAIDQRLQALDFNKILVRHAASTYMFRLRGNEWEDAGIYDGDIAVVDRNLDPKKSDAVLWWNEPKGEFSISKYTDMPKTATCWGVITSTIHQLRKD